MSKLGSETKDKILPVFASINNAAAPVALKVLIELSNSLLIIYCMLLSKVNFKGRV